jgi:hypothetical protein
MDRSPDTRSGRLERVGKLLRGTFFVEFLCPFFVCVAIYYWFFASRFLRQDIVMGGDTQLIWSFFYFNIFSLLNFHEFAWWDPTAFNGWPSYFYATSVYVSYLSPYTLPTLGLAAIGHLLGRSINFFLILHLTLISYALNLVAIMLISRELIRDPLARFLPALIFTLSEISFHGFRDAWLYAAMPPALFYLFGLIYYNNRRTPWAFVIFVFFTGAFLASLNYSFLQSSLWWTLAFSFLVLVFFPDLIKATSTTIAQLWAVRYGRALLGIGLVFWISAFVAFFTPLWFNLDNVIRVSGAGPVNFAVGLSGDFDPSGILAWPVWTNFLMWSPLPELHDSVLKFDPWGAGIDHRYVGMVTLPLLFIALLRSPDNRYILVTFLTFAVCALFIVYTVQNLALLPLIENFPALQNIRVMSNIMPREGPSIMIMLLSGLGLDALMKEPEKSDFFRVPPSLLGAVLLALIAFGFVLGVLGASSVGAEVRGALTHMAIHLTISALLCLLLLFTPTERSRPICVALLIMSFLDLTISASAYWKRGKVWFANQGVHKYPSPRTIGPISSSGQSWAGSYRGLIHSLAGGPYYGMKTWLVLAYRPEWYPVLVNWDPESRMMMTYPSFQFFSNAAYVPFDSIKAIDAVPVPTTLGGYQLSVDSMSIESANGSIMPIRSGGLTGSVDSVAANATSVKMSGWAIDETAKTVPEKILVFAGQRLWMAAEPRLERSDIANAFGPNYRSSGFSIASRALPPEQRVGIRVFALMHDRTARELAYAGGFPFSRDGRPANNPLPTLEEFGQRAVESFYVHDESAKTGLAGNGKLLKEVPATILAFSPNTVRARVNAPSDLFMVSNDNYDRFWTATVDGLRVPIYRANYTYKAIRVPAGEHVVEWRYDPWPVKVMWLWFYATLAMFGGVWFLWHRRSFPSALSNDARPASCHRRRDSHARTQTDV